MRRNLSVSIIYLIIYSNYLFLNYIYYNYLFLDYILKLFVFRLCNIIFYIYQGMSSDKQTNFYLVICLHFVILVNADDNFLVFSYYSAAVFEG